MGFRRGGAAVVGLLLLACTAGVWAAAYRVDVKGLEGNLAQNVDIQVKTLLSGSVPEERQAFRAQLHRAIRTGLRALGHYRPEIRYEWEKNAKGEETDLLHVTVDPGEPVLVSETSVTFRGGAEKDRAFERLKRRLPKKGTVLNHGDYEDFKSRIEAVAVRKGYFDGGFKRKVLGVDAEKREAYWWLEYDSGERYRFGKTTFEGSQIDDDILQNLIPYKEGSYYNSNRVAELNSRLSETGWFNSVVVVPQMEEGRESKVLPMAGNLTPKSANSVEVGAGFSTDVGPTFKTTWRKPWLNSRGHSLTGVLDLSSKEQELGFGYKLPLAENALEQYWLFQGGYKHEDLNDTKSDSTMLSASRNWDYEDGWQRTVNLRWSLDKFKQADVTNTTMLITPGVSISRTRTKGGMMPTWGDSQRYSLDVSSEWWASDVDFAVLQAQVAMIRTYAKKHRFVLRSHFGWIETSQFDQVPPDLRFFAGGDRSVRGYDYKSISPENDEGELTGASRLAVGSIEYQYNVTGKWWGAVFVDAGEAVNDFNSRDFKIGAGVGVRWASPLGPIKFDIARPVSDREEKGWQFYIGLGPEL